MNRKTFVHAAGWSAASLLISIPVFKENASKIKAIAFDAFAIFDPVEIFRKIDALFPGKGKQIIEVWQSRHFSYQWLRVTANKYKDFGDISKNALDFALVQSGLDLSEQEKKLILAKYETMNAWADVIPALQALKKEGLILCFLSNMTSKILHSGIRNSNLSEFFDLVISTDEKQTYKPSQMAYQLAIEKLKLRKEEILFVPFAGWDMAGATWFGYPTFWLNRLNAPQEELDAEPRAIGSNLNDLVEFIKSSNES